MIEWLYSLLIPITLLLGILLAVHRFLRSHLSMNYLYLLWGVAPLGVLFFSMPLQLVNESFSSVNSIEKFYVHPTEKIQIEASVLGFEYLWLVGSLALLTYWGVSHFLFKRQLNLTNVDKVTLESELGNIILPASLTVCKSNRTASPMLLGVVKQKLVIPEDFLELYNKEQRQLILEHEICHYDRNDIYWNLIANSFLALFWFHPLVWLAYFRFRRDQELSCDQIVLAQKQVASRINYSRALLVVAETSPVLAFAQLSFKKYGDKEVMLERIKQIKSNNRSSKVSLLLVSVLSVSLLSGLSYAGNIGEQKNTKSHRVPPKAKASVAPLHRVEPEYPAKAVAEKIEGAVILKFDVDSRGDVKNVEVVMGEPAYVFDRVSVAALKEWKYKANGTYNKNQLVQLDYRLDKNSTYKRVDLLEKIEVIQ